MGKRTKDKSEEEIRKKIRKLEDELRNRQSTSPIINQFEDRDYDDCTSAYNYHEELELDAYGISASAAAAASYSDEERSPGGRRLDLEQDTAAEPGVTNTQQPIIDDGNIPQEEHHVPNPENGIKSLIVEVDPNNLSGQNKEDSVPTEILAILGEAKKSSETLGKKIPAELSERWGQILLEGLAKEQKETLISKTLVPENFQLAKAPKLNAEVASVLSDPAKNRDKRLEKMQSQLGFGISGLVNLTADLINKDMCKMDLIKRVSEINQILLDLHYEETMNRRRLIIPMLDKKFINIIQGVKRDEFLFGDKLGDNIKTSKSIEQSSLQIKKSVPPQPGTSRKSTGPQGNSRAPLRAGGGPATARAQPAPYRYYPPPPPPQAARRPPPPPRRAPPRTPPQQHTGRSYDRRTRQ